MTSTGATVVMCTHLLLEAEGLADQVVVLDEGRDLVRGEPAELARRFWPSAMVRVDAEDRVAAAAVLRSLPGVSAVDGDAPMRVSVDDHARVPELVFALVAAGVRVKRVEPYEPSLEDLYFTVRGHRR
jgi:ABC-2 type transport system ATP-binding protein